MSVEDAKRQLDIMRTIDAAETAGVPEDTREYIKRAVEAKGMLDMVVGTLALSSDKSSAKNYVAVTMEGLPLPFDRAVIELVRPGGKHSSELASELRRLLMETLALLDPDLDLVAEIRRAIGGTP